MTHLRSIDEELHNLYQKGETSLFVVRCEELLALARANPLEQETLSILLDYAAEAYSGLCRYNDAIESTKAAITIDRARLGEISNQHVRGLSNLGSLYRRIGQLFAADAALTHALVLNAQLPIEEQELHASTIMINLAYVKADVRDFRSAQRLLIKAAQLRLQETNWRHPRFGDVFHHWGQLFLRTGEQFAAERAIRKALRIRHNAAGTESDRYATMLKALGDIKRQQHNIVEAHSCYSTAIDVLSRLGPLYREQITKLRTQLADLVFQQSRENGNVKP